MKPGSTFGGVCARFACNGTDATWFNSSTRLWYCTSCARKINEHNPPGICQHQPRTNEPRQIVAIVGPVALWDRLVAIYNELTLAGHIVFLPCNARFHGPVSDEQLTQLNALHARKIEMSDRVVVVIERNYNGGAGTQREVAFAESIGKPVEWVWL